MGRLGKVLALLFGEDVEKPAQGGQRCINKGCDGYMICLHWQIRGNPLTGKPTKHETWQCPSCHILARFGRPTTEKSGSWKLDIPERLKALGYL